MADRVGHRLGNYRLLRVLGQGGFGEVYLAEHLHLKTQAAVKMLNANLPAKDREGFLAEAQTVAQLRHPHIIRILEFGVADGIPFLVMDYAPRGTLRAQYPKGTRLPLATIVPYTKQVTAALQYAHERKLVHRDVKPENLLLDAQGAVLLSDFGTATLARNSQSYQREAVMGTVAYMAPEQLRGQPRPASDQYALGVVVYEWLVGERPFQGSFAEIASQQLFAPPPPLRAKLPVLAPAVEEVVLRALAKDPKARFASVQDFAAALEHASQDMPGSRSTMPVLATPPQQALTGQGDEVTLPATARDGLLEMSVQTATEEMQRPWHHRPRLVRPRGKPAVLLAASILPLGVALALLLLLVARSFLPAGLVNAAVTKTATTDPTRTATASATNQVTPAGANAPYSAAIPGPCDTTSDARWTAVGTYHCLADALLVTRLQGNDDAGVYFSGSGPASAALPLNYDMEVHVSHLQGAICVMISSVFSLANPTTGPDRIGTLEVDLCSDQTLLVYALPSPNANGPASPIYSASLAPQASYTVTISCTMPTCVISVNDSGITSAPYANITHMNNIGFTVLGNDAAKVAAGSAEFDHFRFTPAH